MLKDERARRFATEFGGNWLDFRRFDEHNAVDRERFPEFSNELRAAMFEEPIRFITDIVRNDRSVLDMLYGSHTFANPILAKHYGMPEVYGSADRWVRMDNARDVPARRAASDGGVPYAELTRPAHEPGQARVLGRAARARRGHSPAAAHRARAAEGRSEAGSTAAGNARQASRQSACSSCHARFDSFGLTFEGYGPVGETRTKDLAGRAVDTQATFPGGSQGTGLAGLQSYIRANRESDFMDNLSRKMLVYALGRSLLLSDEPLIQRMNAKLAANGYRFSALVEAIVTSPQFLKKRT